MTFLRRRPHVGPSNWKRFAISKENHHRRTICIIYRQKYREKTFFVSASNNVLLARCLERADCVMQSVLCFFFLLKIFAFIWVLLRWPTEGVRSLFCSNAFCLRNDENILKQHSRRSIRWSTFDVLKIDSLVKRWSAQSGSYRDRNWLWSTHWVAPFRSAA